MDFKDISEYFEKHIEALFSSVCSGLAEREDSRAFGAMIEKAIAGNWERMCQAGQFSPLPVPGRRSIFDFSCKMNGRILGFDVKTKDMDSNRYSDGGVCAVGNLLKFMANDSGALFVIEFGHHVASPKSRLRVIEYIRVAPFHILPQDAYRIENLGTGQIRLNYSLNQVWRELDWQRTYDRFFDFFCTLAITHYKSVQADAESRINSIRAFKEGGYAHFKFIKE